MSEVSIVIPTYNESENIVNVLNVMSQHLILGMQKNILTENI